MLDKFYNTAGNHKENGKTSRPYGKSVKVIQMKFENVAKVRESRKINYFLSNT